MFTGCKVCVTCSSVSSVIRACSLVETITSKAMGVICLFPLPKELLSIHLCYPEKTRNKSFLAIHKWCWRGRGRGLHSRLHSENTINIILLKSSCECCTGGNCQGWGGSVASLFLCNQIMKYVFVIINTQNRMNGALINGVGTSIPVSTFTINGVQSVFPSPWTLPAYCVPKGII
jgi:hypothetical protein